MRELRRVGMTSSKKKKLQFCIDTRFNTATKSERKKLDARMMHQGLEAKGHWIKWVEYVVEAALSQRLCSQMQIVIFAKQRKDTNWRSQSK